MILLQLGSRLAASTERGAIEFPRVFAGAFMEGKSLGKLTQRLRKEVS